jgi:hypothetical protein
MNTYVPVHLTDTQRTFIETNVMGADFPWFWQATQTHDRRPYFWEEHIPEELRPNYEVCNAPFFSHTLMARSFDREQSGTIVSPYYEVFAEIFHKFLRDNGLTCRRVYRMNLNLTTHHSSAHTVPHLDHEYPHNNFIMYLDSCPNAQTLVFDDDFATTNMYEAEQYWAVAFAAQFHAHRYPPPELRRTVLVVTWG